MPPPFGWGGRGKNFLSVICIVQNWPISQNHVYSSNSIAITEISKKAKKGACLPFPLGGIGKFFGSAFKSNVQNRPKSQKSCL